MPDPGRVSGGEQTAEAASILQFAQSAGDPLRPLDIVLAPGLHQAPPFCPLHEAEIFLNPVQQNAAGDVLLMCFADGYETVYRVATGVFEPRPNRIYSPAFEPPRFAHKKIPVRAAVKPTRRQASPATLARRAATQTAAGAGLTLTEYYAKLATLPPPAPTTRAARRPTPVTAPAPSVAARSRRTVAAPYRPPSVAESARVTPAVERSRRSGGSIPIGKFQDPAKKTKKRTA